MKKYLFILLTAFIAGIINLSCSKTSDVVDQNQDNAKITNTPTPKEVSIFGGLAGRIEPVIKGTIIIAASAQYSTPPTSPQESGDFLLEGLPSDMYDIYFNYEVNGVYKTIVLERISVKPGLVNNIGTVWLQ